MAEKNPDALPTPDPADDPCAVNIDSELIAQAVAEAFSEAFGGGDGTLDIELVLPDCLKITNCDGETLEVALSAESIAALVSALEAATLSVGLTTENINELVEALAGACLSFKQCEGEVFDVAVNWGDMPPVEIAGPVDVNIIGSELDLTVDIDELKSQVVGQPLYGCLDGEPVSGMRFWLVHTDGSPAQDLGNTLPDGASDEPCPCIVEVVPPVACCDIRMILEGDATHDIPTLLGLGTGYTVPTFQLTIQKTAVKDQEVPVVDCDGNPSTALCGESIKYYGGEADQHSVLTSVTTVEGDRVILEARVCPPLEATDV